jgi:YHS domain-containing protein
MKIELSRCLIAVACALAPAMASAQHEGHQVSAQAAAGPGADPTQLAACVESQRQTSTLVEAANARLEAARQTNQPSMLRSAMEDLQTTLSTIRTQLSTCTQIQAASTAGMPAGHNMTTMPGAPNAPASPPGGPGTPVINPGSTNSPPGSANPAPAPSKMVMVMTATDPSRLQCPTKTDPKTATKTTYKGKTYYFCSQRDRDEFLTDPEMSLSMRPPR